MAERRRNGVGGAAPGVRGQLQLSHDGAGPRSSRYAVISRRAEEAAADRELNDIWTREGYSFPSTAGKVGPRHKHAWDHSSVVVGFYKDRAAYESSRVYQQSSESPGILTLATIT